MLEPRDVVTADFPSVTGIKRDTQQHQIEVYLPPLRERLPNIPVPLWQGELDALLQLRPLTTVTAMPSGSIPSCASHNSVDRLYGSVSIS